MSDVQDFKLLHKFIMHPRLSSQKCTFFKFLLSLNSQKRLGYKVDTRYRSLSRKPAGHGSHVRILIYRTWPIAVSLFTVAISL